jgi:transposase InsO family protein
MRGWNNTQAAKAFHLCDATIASWLTRIEETGPGALVQTPVPVNKFPDFVGQLVQQLKTTCPTMGKVRISQMLAKAGLHLSPSTAKRMLTRRCPNSPDTEPASTRSIDSNATNAKESESSSSTHDKPARVVTAKYPGHVWHTDLTVVPTALGFWIPWLPFAIGQHWPFCYWVVAVLDHFSRKCLMAHASRSQPSTDDVTNVLDTAIAIAGKAPKYIVSDQGPQFRDDYELWCLATGIKPRFGAIGQHGSIAILERFILSLKDECTRRMLVPLSLTSFQDELLRYVVWYNEYRPHQSLAGCTPNEIYDGTRSVRDACRLATRTEPRKGKNHAVVEQLQVERVTKLRLVVSQLDGRQHLPIVKLNRAA